MYCKKCGAQSSDDSAFCPKCGASMQESTLKHNDNSKIKTMNTLIFTISLISIAAFLIIVGFIVTEVKNIDTVHGITMIIFAIISLVPFGIFKVLKKKGGNLNQLGIVGMILAGICFALSVFLLIIWA